MAHHLPAMKVLYPAALIFVPMPVMLRGIAAKPETGSSGLWMSGAAFSGFCARDPGQRETEKQTV